MMFKCRDCREDLKTQDPCPYCGSNDVVTIYDYYDEPNMGIIEEVDEDESY